MLIVGLK